MIKRANLKGGTINVGDIIRIGINRVDLAKTDCKNLTLMVVKEKTFKKKPSMYRLANKLFQMSTLYGAGSITVIKDLNPKLVDLDGVVLNYQGLPKMNEQAAAKQMSLVRGQSVKCCNCKGRCNTRICSGYKLGIKCVSECHEGNSKCENC